MQFTPIDRNDIPKVTKRENAASTKLIQGFLESGIEVAKIDMDEGAKLPSVRSTLQNYVKRHELPVRVFTRTNDLYLERVTADDASAETELANA